MSVQDGNENNKIEEDNISEVTPVETSTEENSETSVLEKSETKIKAENKIDGVNGKDSFISIIIDQVISLGVSAAALFIIDGIMQLLGWYIQDKEGMFIIFFVIVNVIYNTIMHKSKTASTFGEKVAHLKITK